MVPWVVFSAAYKPSSSFGCWSPEAQEEIGTDRAARRIGNAPSGRLQRTSDVRRCLIVMSAQCIAAFAAAATAG